MYRIMKVLKVLNVAEFNRCSHVFRYTRFTQCRKSMIGAKGSGKVFNKGNIFTSRV